MSTKHAYYSYALFRFEKGNLIEVNEIDYHINFRCGKPIYISKTTGKEENVVRAINSKNAAKRFLTICMRNQRERK